MHYTRASQPAYNTKSQNYRKLKSFCIPFYLLASFNVWAPMSPGAPARHLAVSPKLGLCSIWLMSHGSMEDIHRGRRTSVWRSPLPNEKPWSLIQRLVFLHTVGLINIPRFCTLFLSGCLWNPLRGNRDNI